MRVNDPEYNNDLEAKSDVKITGEAAPFAASQMLKRGVEEPSEDVSLTYDWGDRGATTHELSAQEAGNYLLSIADKRGTNIQALGKEDESNYWRKNEEAIFDDSLPEFVDTPLPNPIKASLDGEIDASVSYQDGVFGVFVELDTEYDGDEEVQDGNLRITYTEELGEGMESELERTEEAISRLKDLNGLLEE